MRVFLKLLPRFAVSTITIVIILLAGEYYVRNYVIMSHNLAHTLMAKRWTERYWGTPNNLGYRDRNWTPEDVEGQTRILVTGDSFAEGFGIKDLENRFANVLNSELGDDYAVMVAAASGWELSSELLAIHRFPYDADALVLSYYINDIDGSCSTLTDLDLLPSSLADPPGMLNDLVQTSHLADYLWWNFFARQQIGEVFSTWSDNVEACYNDELVWQYHEAELLGIYNWTRLRGIPLAVVIFPDMVNLDRLRPELARVQQFFSEHDVPVIALAEEWRAYSVSDRVASPFDAHAGELPHRDVGEALAQLDILRNPSHTDFTPTLEALLTPTAYDAYRAYIASDDPFEATDVVFMPGTDANISLELSTVAANLAVLNPNLPESEIHKIFDWLRTWERMQSESDLDLSEAQAAALTQWRESKLADDLRAAGIDYVFTDSYWDAWLTEESYANLYQSDGYESIHEWGTYTSAVYYRLVRVADAP
jgi:hypothetical protein